MRKVLSYKLFLAFLGLPTIAFLSTDVKAQNCLSCEAALECLCRVAYPDDIPECEDWAVGTCSVFPAKLHREMAAKIRNKGKSKSKSKGK